MALKHRRAALVQLVFKGLHNIRMVVTSVVHAIAGKKIQKAAAVFSEQFAASATLVTDIHAENVQQGDPLGIHILFVRTVHRAGGRQLRSLSCHKVMDAPRLNIDAFGAGSAKGSCVAAGVGWTRVGLESATEGWTHKNGYTLHLCC